ncbi:MAG: GGDEF domain-containing protein [Eubacteriales bacterium]|nr:GGDEF domain-containing protein [Eubacteriales bacterium]
MMVENLIRIILIAISYYLFSNEFFKFSAEIEDRKVTHTVRFLSFLLVYAWFMIASYLQLPLVVNWFVFLMLLGLEMHFAFSFDYLISYALSLFCIITGLAVNVFFRSFVSILLNEPLNSFDNNISTLKAYPIFIGFMVMALLFVILRRRKFSSDLKKMLRNRKSLVFYMWTEVFIYAFLLVQLLAFSQSENNMGIKTWGIKSSLFSVFVLVISIVYSLRVASLNYYMEKQHEMRNHLMKDKKDINKLWKLAFTDMLTGCSNRQLLDKRLEEYAGYGSYITLAFIDVNGLKYVNDQYGHMEGDKYLINVSRTLEKVMEGVNVDLFRYGGDEFVMISNTLCERDITELLEQVNQLLMDDKEVHYTGSVSYGVIRGDCSTYHKLIAEADDLMYKYKMKYYEAKVRS